MLAVSADHRGKGIASTLVRKSIEVMIERDAEEVFSPSLLTELPHAAADPYPPPPQNCSLMLNVIIDSARNRSHQHSRHEAV